MAEKHLRFAFIFFVVLTILLEGNEILAFEIAHIILFIAFLGFLGITILYKKEKNVAAFLVLVVVAVGVVISVENILQLTAIEVTSMQSLFQFGEFISSVFLSCMGFLEWMLLSYPEKILE